MLGFDSIWHWLILLVIVALLFGTSKLRNVGSDLSAAIKNFRKGLQDDTDESAHLKADKTESQPSSSTESKSKDAP